MVANVAYAAIAFAARQSVGLWADGSGQPGRRVSGFFTRLGLALVIVQKPDLTEEDIRAASTTGAVLGTVLFALVWPLTPWICEYSMSLRVGRSSGSGHFSSDH